MTVYRDFVKMNSDVMRNFFFRLTQSFGLKGLDFALYYIMSWTLTRDHFNTYIYIFSIMSLLSFLVEFGFSHIAAKYFAEHKDDTNNLIAFFNFSHRTIILIFSLVFVAFFILLGGVFRDKGILLPALLGFIFVLADPLQRLMNGMYRGLEKFKSLLYLDLISRAITITAVVFIVTLYAIHGGVIGRGIYYLVPALVLMINLKLFLSKKRNGESSNTETDVNMRLNVVRQTLWILLFNISYFLYTKADIIILEHLGYFDKLAVYDIASQLFLLLQTIFSAYALVIAPKISFMVVAGDFKKIRKAYISNLSLSFAFGIIISLLSIVVFNLAVPVFFPQYDSEEVLRVFYHLLIMLPFFAMWILASGSFSVPLGIPYVLATTGIMMAISNVVLDILLVRAFGFIGAVYTTMCIFAVFVLVMVFWVWTKIKSLSIENRIDAEGTDERNV